MSIENDAVREQVRKTIEDTLRRLELGMEQMKKLTEQIMESLEKSENIYLTPGTIKNDDTQKQIRTTSLMHVMQNDPTFKLDLKKTPDELKDEGKEDQLKNTFKEFLKKMFKLTPKNKSKRDPNKEEEEKIDELAEILARELTKKKKDVPLGENKAVMDILTASIEANYGVDIRQTGRLAKPTLARPTADVSTQNFATEDGTSFMAGLKQETGDDPIGVKLFNLLGNLAEEGRKDTPILDLLHKDGILVEERTAPQLRPYKDNPYST